MIKRIVFLILLICTTICVQAQSGLHINDLFTGKILPLRSGVEIKVKGKAVSKYKLNYYHSFKFEANSSQVANFVLLTKKDETIQSWRKNAGKKSTDILQYKPVGKQNRFLVFVVQQHKGKFMVTAIYMEGWAKDINELNELIKN